MPIYEFRCEDCGRVFEELVMKTQETPCCPDCKSDKTGKLMSACCFKGGESSPDMGSGGMGGGCSGCAGGSCATCH
jgi:putative FmdB family regulatory protein